MQKLAFLFSLLLLQACPVNDGRFRTDIPWSQYDNANDILNLGRPRYENQMQTWRDRISTETANLNTRRELGIDGCRPVTVDDPKLTNLLESFLLRDRVARESAGGTSCRCIPMGETCIAQTCLCSEICPQDHGILRSQAELMAPSEKNSLAFENSIWHNLGAYQRYPNATGFCNGHAVVQRKFQMLSDMQPDLRSWPAMNKGSSEWKEYMKYQISKMAKGESPEFLGVSSFEELMSDPELAEPLKKISRLETLNNNEIATNSFWQKMEKKLGINSKFTQAGAQTIVARSNTDPDTGNALPPEGSQEYHDLIKQKVQSVSQGFPASFPGYSSIHALSSMPDYAEIMGSQVAIDWQQFNVIDMTEQQAPLTRTSQKIHAPMSSSEMSNFLDSIKPSIPVFPEASFPMGSHGNELWNELGPYQTRTIGFHSTLENGKSAAEHGFHAVEAWAYIQAPNGDLKICVKDPNHFAGDDDGCKNYFSIKKPGQTDQEITYSGWPDRKIGKMAIEPSGDGHTGILTSRLVLYCKRVYGQKSKEGVCP